MSQAELSIFNAALTGLCSVKGKCMEERVDLAAIAVTKALEHGHIHSLVAACDKEAKEKDKDKDKDRRAAFDEGFRAGQKSVEKLMGLPDSTVVNTKGGGRYG